MIVLGIRLILLKSLLSFLLCFVTIHSCYAAYLSFLTSMSDLDFRRGDIEVRAPYSILSKTQYTSLLDTYRFENYFIKILNLENPSQGDFKITQKNNVKLNLEKKINIKNINLEKHLPWWSNLAPNILKKLNFSKVDGNADIYYLEKDYRLSLLPEQGAWGKVYLLEDISKNAEAQKICALKLVYTRSDRSALIAFHERHRDELTNNLIISNWDIAVKPYAMIKNDADHYLLFMEYGESLYPFFKKYSLHDSVDYIIHFMSKMNRMHFSGYSHGDLKIANIILINNQFKLCDWYSLKNINQTTVGTYRYIGDNLPPEAIRAHYFEGDEALKYSIIIDKNKEKSYFLHPITADRFCFSISLLEVLEPDLYKNFENLFSKDFNPYKPKSLDFWPRYVAFINDTQNALLTRSKKMNAKERALYMQLAEFLDLNPEKRNIH